MGTGHINKKSKENRAITEKYSVILIQIQCVHFLYWRVSII